ncbi:hypothetical protein HALLA_01520 (plasmid) [Halostagnicola larsenii XH-48]|uniref:Uncharacterized protein n=1 Tax=Halostagnicola larsenii XH-48 TaxID=797299 RepID=W0JTR9_9EURY|nr:hypothetical protein HALLA_01520 [Halostagnicola larsenii XH-48]
MTVVGTPYVLAGAALGVFEEKPLPESSPL